MGTKKAATTQKTNLSATLSPRFQSRGLDTWGNSIAVASDSGQPVPCFDLESDALRYISENEGKFPYGATILKRYDFAR